MLLENIGEYGKSIKEKVEKAKELVRESGMKELKIYTNPFANNKEKVLYCTLYLKESTDHSFHVYGIFEPNVDRLSGVDGIFTEWFYDLKNKEYKVIRNFKEVNFSSRNIDGMVKHVSHEELFAFLANDVKEIQEMYDSLYFSVQQLIAWELFDENRYQASYQPLSKVFERLMLDFPQLETLYKSGFDAQYLFGKLTKEGNSFVPKKLKIEYHSVRVRLDFTKTKPHQILMMSKSEIKRFEQFRKEFMETPNYEVGARYRYREPDLSSLGEWQRYASSASYIHKINIQLGLDETQRKTITQELQQAGREYFGILDSLEEYREHYDSGSLFIHMIHFNFTDYLRYKWGNELRDKLPVSINGSPTTVPSALFSELKDAKINLKQALYYLFYRTHFEQGMTNIDKTADYYNDYLRMMRQMNAPNVDKYPQSLKLAHDVAAMNYKVAISEIQEEAWKEIHKKNAELFSWENKEYQIVYPETPQTVVNEGNALSHCVGSYVSSILKGVTHVVFLRKKENLEEPLITIEIRDGKIRQALGKFNSKATGKDAEAVEQYKKERGF